MLCPRPAVVSPTGRQIRRPQASPSVPQKCCCPPSAKVAVPPILRRVGHDRPPPRCYVSDRPVSPTVQGAMSPTVVVQGAVFPTVVVQGTCPRPSLTSRVSDRRSSTVVPSAVRCCVPKRPAKVLCPPSSVPQGAVSPTDSLCRPPSGAVSPSVPRVPDRPPRAARQVLGPRASRARCWVPERPAQGAVSPTDSVPDGLRVPDGLPKVLCPRRTPRCCVPDGLGLCPRRTKVTSPHCRAPTVVPSAVRCCVPERPSSGVVSPSVVVRCCVPERPVRCCVPERPSPSVPPSVPRSPSVPTVPPRPSS